MKISISSYIVSSFALCLLLIGCSDKQVQNWTPCLQNDNRPFSMGKLIQLYAIQTGCDDDNVSSPGNTIMDISNHPELANEKNVAIISPGALTLRTRYISGRIKNGYNTLIAAEKIIPIIGGSLTFKANGDFIDDSKKEAKQKSVNNIGGTVFNFDSFLKQAQEQEFPEFKIYTPLGGESPNMPSILCSRHLKEEALLKNLGQNYRPKNTEVIMSAGGKPIAIRYTFQNNCHLTIVSAPLLFSNYAISLEDAKFAHKAMYILDLAFDTSNNLSMTGFNLFADGFESNWDVCAHFILQGMEYDNKYDYKSDYVSQSSSSSSSDSSIGKEFLWYLLKHLWPFLLLFIPIILIRRQRVIKIHEGYKNRSAEYAKHVGSLYAHEGDSHHILNNTIAYFFYDIKDRYAVDLTDVDKLKENASILASHWNQNQIEVYNFLSNLNRIRNASDGMYISPDELASICEQINLYSKQ